ncbi:MAG: hypothetical protein JW910_21005 [Anaerolineae bacterium]|nr:hypothetical protein [Anaerolineae bacterium]
MVRKCLKVIDGPLSVCSAASGDQLPQKLIAGDEIVVDEASRTEADGYVWWKHSAGWSASQGNGDVFMVELEDVDTDTPLYFTVIDGPLGIRATPNGSRFTDELDTGAMLAVSRISRTEAGGYIWWQHDRGWSAERTASGSQRFMEPVPAGDPAAPGQAVSPVQRVPIPAYLTGQQVMQVVQSVKVCDRPASDPHGLVLKWIARGEALTCDFDTLTEADGYFWVRHELGWSAVQSVDGQTVFLVEPLPRPGAGSLFS